MSQLMTHVFFFFWRIRFIIVTVLYMVYSFNKIDPETA